MLLEDQSLSQGRLMSPHLSPNPFAEAILSFIDEIRDNEDRKSIFYKEVVQVACRLYMTDEPAEQSLISATELSSYISDLELHHRKKSVTRRAFASAQPLVEGLLQYTSAVDVMIQADPTASALIYGGAKLVLQLANGYTKYFEQITQMLADIGVQLQYFHIYTQEFATEKYMSGILCNSYRDILLFWRDASKILNQRGKRFLAAGLLVPFNERYAKFKQKLDKNAQNVRHMAQALHVRSQGSFNRSQELQVRDLATALNRSSSPRPPSYESEIRGQSPSPSSSQQEISNVAGATRHDEIRRWIAGGRASRIDPQSDLDRHNSSRHIGTSEWIFEDSTFSAWRSSGESASLWVNAAPGSGKSVLSASIIDKLMQSEKKEQRNVIYFFCRFDEPEKCKAISALRSLAIQALKLIKYVPDELYQLYQDEFSPEDSFVANISIAERVLGYLLKRIDYVSVVVDGLDECHESAILDSLIRLRDQKGFGITKWLFTSRNDAVIRKRFENSKTSILTVPSKVVQNDIRKFLEDNSDILCGTSDQLDRIAELSQGNFLMMRLTVDPFRNEELTCSEEFEEALDDFQPELARCWFRSLERLAQRSDQVQELAQLIFTAVIAAVQPMTFNELLDLLSVKIGQEPSDRRRRTRSVVLSACSPFVEVDYEIDFVNPTLRLVHKSVGEFLTQDPASMDFVTRNCYKFFVKYKEGHADMGRRCLTYLSYKRYADFADLDVDDVAQEHGLLKYASIFWYQHLHYAGGSEELFHEIRKFLKSPNLWACVRIQSKYAPHMFAKLSYSGKEDVFSMHLPKSNLNTDSSVEEYYADALPPWIDRFDNQGDHLTWGYHMFVREWGEVLVKYPDKIRQYFAKVLGSRSFWSCEDGSDGDVEIKTFSDKATAQELLQSYDSDGSCTPVWQSQTMDEELPITYKDVRGPYIKNALKEHKGDWKFHHCTTIRQDEISATVYRYKLRSSSPVEDDDDDDKDDSEDESSEDEKPVPKIVNEPAIWFLSVTDGKGKVQWFHHKAKSGILQKSTPIFLPQTSWVLWPQDETSILYLNTTAWVSTAFNLPSPGKTDLMIISQDHHFSTVTNSLYRAAIYGSTTRGFTIKHTVIPFTSLGSSSEPPQIDASAILSQETIWRFPNTSFTLPTSFFWHDTVLYAALGSPIVKLLRFPPPLSPASPGSEPSNPLPIQILNRRLYIPASSYTRCLRFLVQPNSQGTSSRAVFALDAAPKFELPVVILDFKLESREWETYDPNAKDDDSIANNSLSFLKGAYASKEQAFSVPIRSGLDWRRTVYVTCW